MKCHRLSRAILRASVPMIAAVLYLSCSGSDSVTETPVEVARVTLAAPKQALLVGETVQLTATPYSPQGNPMGARPITFVSDHPEVLTVDGAGRARGVARGTATVTATSGGVSGNLAFTVARTPAVALAPDSVRFSALSPGVDPVAQTIQVTNAGDGTLSGLSTQVTYAAGQPAGWLSAQLGGSAAPTTLTLQASRGSLAVGTYRATVVVSGAGATSQSLPVSFTITPAAVASVRVQPDTATLAVGATRTLTATTLDNAGNTLTGRAMREDSSIVIVAGSSGRRPFNATVATRSWPP